MKLNGKNQIKMPRTSEEQAHRVKRISRDDMRKGDLMFYYDSGGVYHVGIFLSRKPFATQTS